MAETNWYYSHGEDQLGPVAASQLKKLAADGKLAPADLVWKEGMDDWVAASSIDGLIPIAPPGDSQPQSAASEPPPAAAPVIASQPRQPISKSRGRLIGTGSAADLLGYARFVAYPALVFGLLLAMMSRGCDQLSSRGIQAAVAQDKLVRQQFDSESTRQRQALEDERDAAREDELNERAAEIDTELSDLVDERKEDKNKLERGKWRDLREDAETAQLNHDIGGWWRELFFRFGTILLAFGLLGVGLTGKGADRWVCLVILVIIILNLYGSQVLVGFRGG